MEDKTFEKDKAPAAEEKTPQAGHNRRRRRRKKSGTRQGTQAAPAQQVKAEEKLSSAPEEKEAPLPEEEKAPAAVTAPETAEPAKEAEPETAPAETATEKTAPEAPQLPEEASASQEPESPEPPETPEAAEEAEKAEEAEEPESAEEAGKAEEAETAHPAEPEKEEPEQAEPAPEPQTSEEPASDAEESEPAESEPSGDEEEQTAEQRRRAAEMTRTVQISIEKIVESIEENVEAQESEEEPDSTDTAGNVPLSRLEQLHQTVGDSAWALLKWLAFVLAFVAVVAGAGIAWLYKGATPDSIPQVSAVFNGQELQATSYSWHVPVVANVFKRTYAKTISKDPVQIEETIQTAQVQLDVEHTSCDTLLTVEDSTGEVVFEGTAEEFGNFTFAQNDTYTAELEVFRNEKQISHTAEVSGKQTYLFTFTVSLRPSIRLNTVSTTQGGVAAVRISGGISDGTSPVLSTELSATAFHQSESGWVCYLPIPVDQEPGTYNISVSYAGYTQELSLTVKERSNVYKDYSYKSQLTSPYIAEEDTPAKVLAVLSKGSQNAAWGDDGFMIPFADKAEVELAYGTTEYVGRTRSERIAGTGTGRVSTNAVISTTRGGDLVAPAAGTVLLAEDLGDTAGYTIVIDHGAGVKSIFYCLREISVKAGATVKAGQVIAETDRTTIGEVRIGDVPVEPLAVWRGECDALNHY